MRDELELAGSALSPPARRTLAKTTYGRWRVIGASIATLLLVLAFSRMLLAVLRVGMESQVCSYILVVPFVSLYLAYLRWRRRPRPETSWIGAVVAAIAGAGLLIWARGMPSANGLQPTGDVLAVSMLAFLALWVAIAFLFFGSQTLRAFAFPICFLLFAIPPPPDLLVALETSLKFASADAANLFFNLFGLPALRDGAVFQLPGVIIEVAQECSGVRSSLVLFLTSLLAANLFLHDSWRRAVLVLAVLPLGILRNGFRVYVIGWLCSRYGVEMVHSPLHTRGGPLFFALSLVPLALLLWWLHALERRSVRKVEMGANGLAEVRK